MYLSPIGGYEFHEKVTNGSYEYYLFINKNGKVLIKRFDPIVVSMRYGFTVKSLSQAMADPVNGISYRRLDEWKV